MLVRDWWCTYPGGDEQSQRVEEAVPGLAPAELDAFRVWFAEFDAAAWDGQLEDDATAGHLDASADEAVADLQAGRCTDR